MGVVQSRYKIGGSRVKTQLMADDFVDLEAVRKPDLSTESHLTPLTGIKQIKSSKAEGPLAIRCGSGVSSLTFVTADTNFSCRIRPEGSTAPYPWINRT
jgi:hypothetical protein